MKIIIFAPQNHEVDDNLSQSIIEEQPHTTRQVFKNGLEFNGLE